MSETSQRPTRLEYIVDGMDCASCVHKVEALMERLPGTSDIKTSFTKQTLELTLDETQTERAKLERSIKSLGYEPHPQHPVTHGTSLEYFVDGMDCATCVRKVEGVVERLPGTSDIKTSFSKQTLQLTLDERQTPRAKLEGNIKSLGYEPRPLSPAYDGAADHALALGELPSEQQQRHAAQADQAWYATKQGKLVITSGALLLLAWIFSFTIPALSYWGFAAATVLGTWPLARKAWSATRVGQPFTINTLVSIAALGALLIGEAAEGAVVVFFFAIGELLEGIAAGRARAGIRALAALAPKTAHLLDGRVTREVPAAGLQVGQLVQVRPGGRVPADGTIVSGTSSLDDSPVTGESVPVYKGEGDSVYAGSINTDGVLTVRVDKTAADNTIARIIHLVEEAEGSKAPTARFIDRFSRSYTPGVVLISALVALVPPLAFGGDWYDWLYRGITLLLIGCPCALVLSVPAAITSGISAGARRGLLIKGGAALEAIGSVRTIAFDKTGTLTANKPRVTDLIPLSVSEHDLLALAAAVETGSNHPLAKAIQGQAQDRQVQIPTVSDARAIPGKAVTAIIAGRALAVGSPRFAQEQAPLAPEVQARLQALEEQGKTVVVLLDGAAPLGLIAIRDEPREDAREAIAQLKALGVAPVMLTGDNARTGSAIARDLGLDVRAELMPEDKLKLVSELKQRGDVAMIGDGINDAPALAAADVGIAMGGGTDVAIETADAALLRERVSGVTDLVRLSRATMTNIKQNIAFALGLKAIFLITTLFGFTTLWMAILADTGATAIVTANALRLLAYGRRERTGTAPGETLETVKA